jgi:hypothetical protein
VTQESEAKEMADQGETAMKRLFTTTALAATLALLLAISARAANTDRAKTGARAGDQQSTVAGIVVPDNLYDRQPFSFAVPQGDHSGPKEALDAQSGVQGVSSS